MNRDFLHSARVLEQIRTRTLPPPSPEFQRLAAIVVKQRDEEDRRVAAMTPAERDAHIAAWARRLARDLVDAGD